ncbi:pyridoxal phosphate-dependent aminotransferase [Ruegeria sp. HKCCSA071]|uniref:pyridoxal phosphate-dependent aminotransferase n=1 Tax=unclassified Ruegeria TaxID=2625375 RepID=UPI0032AF16F5
MFHRANRLNGIELSEIVQISEAAARLRSEGRDVLALSTGEPDLPTPAHVVEAAHAAALDGKTKYPPTAGVPDLRAEIARQAKAEVAEVIVSTGAKQVIANAMLASLDPGDEVIMPAPYWTSYSDIVRMAGGTPVILPCPMDQGFKLLPEQLEAAITPRTRWLMLNTPSNPSGAIYTQNEIAALASVLSRHPQVWVLADEIYRHLSFTPFVSVAEAAPDLADRLLIVDGVAKAWSMTGWRIGWGIGPVELIKAMVAVQGQVTSGACSIAQWASLAALTGSADLLEERRAVFSERRNLVVAGLNAVPGLRCAAPDGAFYAFPSCAGLLEDQGGPFKNDADFCTWLLEDAGVALVPGRAFGLPGHFRLSFAYAQDTIAAGLARLKAAVERKLS